MAEEKDSAERSLRIRWGKVDSLSLYEVTEDELETLCTGGAASLLLNFGLSLLSIALSFIVTLLSTDIKSERTFVVFVLISIVGFVGAAILLLMWNRNRQSISSVVQRIRRRMPIDMPNDDIPVDKDAQQTDAVDRK